LDPKGVLNHMTQSNVTDLGSALSSHRRVSILMAVSKSPHTVGALAKVLGVAQSTASFHLAQLLRAGLINVLEEGTEHIVTGNFTEIRIRLVPKNGENRAKSIETSSSGY